MVMYLVGVIIVVVLCGIVFGGEYLVMLCRLMMDDSFFCGELIYVFDGDEVGCVVVFKVFDGE